MRFAVRFLRHRGRVLPWREVVNREPLIGDLRIEECQDPQLRRCVRTATLNDPDISIYRAGIPTLLDVRLLAMSPIAFTLPDSSACSEWSTRSRGLLRYRRWNQTLRAAAGSPIGSCARRGHVELMEGGH